MENLHSADKGEVGRIIVKLRRAANLSQTDLGKLIRVRRHHIISWENGESYPQESKLRRLIAVFVAWRVLTPGRERQQAEQLWQLVSLASAAPLSEFNTDWFNWLLPPSSGHSFEPKSNV